MIQQSRTSQQVIYLKHYNLPNHTLHSSNHKPNFWPFEILAHKLSEGQCQSLSFIHCYFIS